VSTEAIKGAEVGSSNAGHVHFTSSIEYFQLCEHESDREEESADCKTMFCLAEAQIPIPEQQL